MRIPESGDRVIGSSGDLKTSFSQAGNESATFPNTRFGGDCISEALWVSDHPMTRSPDHLIPHDSLPLSRCRRQLVTLQVPLWNRSLRTELRKRRNARRDWMEV